MLPADEQTIARYGTEASNGVILITLRYDRPASFPRRLRLSAATSPGRCDWDDSLPAARVVLRYKITTDGRTVPTDELEATDRRLRRPRDRRRRGSTPLASGQKNGAPVESEGVLSIQLPEGRRVPRQAELVIMTTLNPQTNLQKPLKNSET